MTVIMNIIKKNDFYIYKKLIKKMHRNYKAGRFTNNKTTITTNKTENNKDNTKKNNKTKSSNKYNYKFYDLF
jgi:hypothetical protein